jgi:NADH-quinone oxidoreductase subunit H
LLWFLGKLLVFLFAFIWLRGTLPRIRYDQLMALGWKVLIPASLAWTLMIATLRVWRRQGGSVPVYLVAGGILVVLVALTFAWDLAAERAAERRGAADAESATHDVGAFPVPPMDLPHYHGILSDGPGLPDQAISDSAAKISDSAAKISDSAAKEVAGA